MRRRYACGSRWLRPRFRHERESLLPPPLHFGPAAARCLLRHRHCRRPSCRSTAPSIPQCCTRRGVPLRRLLCAVRHPPLLSRACVRCRVRVLAHGECSHAFRSRCVLPHPAVHDSFPTRPARSRRSGRSVVPSATRCLRIACGTCVAPNRRAPRPRSSHSDRAPAPRSTPVRPAPVPENTPSSSDQASPRPSWTSFFARRAFRCANYH